MKPFTSIALLVATFVVAAASPALRVKRIDITQPEEGYDSQYGAVHGARPCGGSGRVVELRVEGCTPDKICQIPHDGTVRRSELEFVPSQDIEQLGVRINVVENGVPKTVHEKAIPNSAVVEGEHYIVNARSAANKDLKGHTLTVQYVLYRVSDNEAEVCAEADYEVV